MSEQSQILAPGPTEIIVRLEGLSLATSAQVIGAVGTAKVIGKYLHQTYQQGDDVIFLLSQSQAHTPPSVGTLMLLREGQVIKKPPGIDAKVAAQVSQALGMAVLILRKYFPTTYQIHHSPGAPSGREQEHDAQTDAVSTVLVTGGETLLSAILIRLLRQTMEDVDILTTCVGVNDEDLLNRTGQMVEHAGAMYAIDADAPNLVTHLSAATKERTGVEGVEVILDLESLVARRPELMSLLHGRALLVDYSAENFQNSGQELFEQSYDVTRTFGELLYEVPRNVLEYGINNDQ